MSFGLSPDDPSLEDLGVSRLAFTPASSFGDISLNTTFALNLAAANPASAASAAAALTVPIEAMAGDAALLRLSADFGAFDALGVFGLHEGSLFGADFQFA
jgi:hypothetical protein